MSIHVDPENPLSLQEIGEIIEKSGVLCLGCHGDYLRADHIKCKDHKGGIPVKGYEGPQWVYFECPSCGFGSALWKVLHEIETKYIKESM